MRLDQAFNNHYNIKAMQSKSSNSKTNKSTNNKKTKPMNSKNEKAVSKPSTALAKVKNSPAEDSKRDFVYEPAFVDVSSLRIHPLLEIVGYDAPDDIFMERTNHFKFFERCVVTEEGYVMTHPTDYLAAFRSGVEKMETVIMKNAFVNDIIDFISFKKVWEHGKSRRKIYEMTRFLEQYVLEQDKEWKKKFKSTKTRGIVAEIMGVSDGSIQNIKKIGKTDPKLLDAIDKKETNSSKAIQLIRDVAPQPQKKTFESRKRYGNLIISNNPNISNGEKALLKVRKAMFEIDEVGVVEFRSQGDKTAVFINDVYITDVVHNVVSDTDYDGKREYCQHHTLLPNDDSFDVQFILKGLEKFIDNQNKLAA